MAFHPSTVVVSVSVLHKNPKWGKVAPMSVRMRHTRGHTNNRRSHHALKSTNIVKDKETGNLRLPHRLDETTGMYRGKLIAPQKAKAVVAKKPTKAKKEVAEKVEETKAK